VVLSTLADDVSRKPLAVLFWTSGFESLLSRATNAKDPEAVTYNAFHPNNN
jgi:hypothetical protein